MTHERDLERLLDSWFAEGPRIVADRVIDDLPGRIARQPQRPAWRLLAWRAPSMPSTFKVAVAALVVVAAVAGLLLIMHPSSSGPSGLPASAPPSTTASTTTSPIQSLTAWWDTGGCGFCAGELAAGTNHSRGLQPGVTYVVPTGWVNTYDQQTGFQLVRDNPANHSCLEAQTATCELLTINRDMRLAASDCSTAESPGATMDAAGVVAELADRPGLVVSTPSAVTVGGLRGFAVEATVAGSWNSVCSDTGATPAVPTFFDGRAHWVSLKGDRSRFFLLDVPGGGNVLVETYVSSADAFASFAGDAQRIIDSFEFATGS